MAHQFFQSEKCDLVVFEVGLGGRLDATNAATPHLSVITNIGLDHQHILGDSLEAIAFEKAGIARQSTPCIIGPQSHPEAKAKLLQETNDHGADVETLQALSPVGGDADFIAANIATASAAYEALRERILPRAGLPKFTPELMRDWSWPGRFELIRVKQDLRCSSTAHTMHRLSRPSCVVYKVISGPKTTLKPYSTPVWIPGLPTSSWSISSRWGVQSISVHPQSIGVFSSRIFDKPLKNLKFLTLCMKALSF